jgi:hypothetical protein
MKIRSSILILLWASVAALAQNAQKPPPSSAVPVPQQLRILSQPEAPLRIALVETTWATSADRVSVQIYIVVENVSDRTVRAYSIRRDVNSTTGPKTCLPNNMLPGKVLRPGERTGMSTWQAASQSDPPPAVWIDYVELSDGKVWGADQCHFAEWLDGARTGGRMQRDQLLGILHDKGADALMAFIRDNFHGDIDFQDPERGERPKLPLAPPPGHSKDWEASFLGGASAILRRVINAHRNWGAAEIEHALRLPFDASEMK